jgi:uncharacterized protein YaiL (DUF2058 family)
MTNSLRDQLLGLGFKTAPKPERKPEHKHAHKPAPGKPPPADQRRAGKPVRTDNRPPRKPGPHTATSQKPAQNKPRTREDIDLAKAYAIRAQREKDERIEAERLKQEEARKRREAKAKLAELIAGKGLNAADAEHVRHFEYGGKIKRIHVTADQLKALNAGELGVLQQDGRYLLVTAALLAEAEAIFAPAVALKVDPNAPAEADPYADPQYQVPDDLVW